MRDCLELESQALYMYIYISQKQRGVGRGGRVHALVVNAWPVGGTNCLGSSQILQRVKKERDSSSNCVPQAVQIRSLSVRDAMSDRG